MFTAKLLKIALYYILRFESLKMKILDTQKDL